MLFQPSKFQLQNVKKFLFERTLYNEIDDPVSNFEAVSQHQIKAKREILGITRTQKKRCIVHMQKYIISIV